MSWVRVEGIAPTHPKIIGLSDAAFRLWIEGMCYSSLHLTDGHISQAAMRSFAAPSAALELIDARLWDATDSGYRIHDYHDYQPTRESIERKLAADRERKRKQTLRSESGRNPPDGIQTESDRIPNVHTIPSHTKYEPIHVSGNTHHDEPGSVDNFTETVDNSELVKRAARLTAATQATHKTLRNPAAWIGQTTTRLTKGTNPEVLDQIRSHPTLTAEQIASHLTGIEISDNPQCIKCHDTGWAWPNASNHVEPCDHRTRP